MRDSGLRWPAGGTGTGVSAMCLLSDGSLLVMERVVAGPGADNLIAELAWSRDAGMIRPMSTAAADIMEAALTLPRENRSALAGRLLESLDDDPAPLSPAWEVELDRRLRSIENGTAKLIPHHEVMAAARAKVEEINRRRA